MFSLRLPIFHGVGQVPGEHVEPPFRDLSDVFAEGGGD